MRLDIGHHAIGNYLCRFQVEVKLELIFRDDLSWIRMVGPLQLAFDPVANVVFDAAEDVASVAGHLPHALEIGRGVVQLRVRLFDDKLK